MHEKVINKKTVKETAYNARMSACYAYCDISDILKYAIDNELPAPIVEKLKRAREQLHLIEFYYIPDIENYLENGKTKIIYR